MSIHPAADFFSCGRYILGFRAQYAHIWSHSEIAAGERREKEGQIQTEPVPAASKVRDQALHHSRSLGSLRLTAKAAETTYRRSDGDLHGAVNILSCIRFRPLKRPYAKRFQPPCQRRTSRQPFEMAERENQRATRSQHNPDGEISLIV